VIAPSGEQVELEAGGQHAVVVEVGGGLRSYSVDGREYLDGYAACPPNAFRTGEAVLRLEPGRSFTSSWGISPLGG
jgi:galactose mutarotase-like enzyme